MSIRVARKLLVLPLLAVVLGLMPGSPLRPEPGHATVAACHDGPRLTPSGGRRWWSDDRHCYTSPWFAGAHRIMLDFGCTPAPYYAHDPRCAGRRGFHHGVDIDMPMRTPIYAGVSGVVVSTAEDGPAYGAQPVKIRAHGVDILLGHLSRRLVQVGQHVSRGQVVGLSGQSGAPDGPHLHFEVRPAGASYTRAIDPRRWLRLSPIPDVAARAMPASLGGVPASIPADSTQVITVNRSHGTYADIALWHLADTGWVRVLHSGDARIGYAGLVAGDQRRRGSGTTPLGTYPLRSSFGSGPPRAGWSLPYRRFTSNDYWVEDPASPYFNQMRDRRLGGFRWRLPVQAPNGSERLADYPTQYAMAVVIGFNDVDPLPRLGGGIFLHVNGRGATAGCVSAPRWFVAAVMADLEPAADPVIAIGR